MTNQDLLEIIKQKGVGEYLGLCDTDANSEKIENYSQYIQMSVEPESKKYFVELLTNKLFSYPEKSLYEGYDEKRAERRFNQAVKEGRKNIKQNKLEEKFSEN